MRLRRGAEQTLKHLVAALCRLSFAVFVLGVGHLADAPRTGDDALRVARALAIEEYAAIESALNVILANLLGIRHDDAAVIFYATTSADTRNRIIKTFISRRHGETYSAYFQGTTGEKKTAALPGMWNLIGKLDSQRHYIVHWIRAGVATWNIGTGETDRWEEYRPPFHETRLTELDPIRATDLNDFISKAVFVSESLWIFGRLIAPKVTLDASTVQTWTPIFQSPPIYPPPADHPVRRLRQAP